MFSTGRRIRGLAAILATASVFFIAVQPVAAANTTFGTKLDASTEFPDNAYPGTYCDHLLTGGSGTSSCTWILVLPDKGTQPTAPKDGKINKIKLIAGKGGSFTLYIAQKSGSKFKVVTKGPKITYATDACSPDCHIQSFSISPITVHKGDYLAVKTAKASFVRCNSGSQATALFKPPLATGGGFATPTDYDGCRMMLQAVYK